MPVARKKIKNLAAGQGGTSDEAGHCVENCVHQSSSTCVCGIISLKTSFGHFVFTWITYYWSYLRLMMRRS